VRARPNGNPQVERMIDTHEDTHWGNAEAGAGAVTFFACCSAPRGSARLSGVGHSKSPVDSTKKRPKRCFLALVARYWEAPKMKRRFFKTN
jgi:hypothetical protein